MRRPSTLPAFSSDEKREAHALLAAKVAYMMRGKLEESDWLEVYCRAKGIPLRRWSNLQIDVMHELLGVEQKMLCRPSDKDISEACGQSLMHPALTRAIRLPKPPGDENDAMVEVFRQYAELVEARKKKVRELSGAKGEPDMRTGWLLWQESLREFLYFEEEMLAPDPADYFAEWHTNRATASRKESVSLWVFERDTKRKRYSITTDAGAKIQPYFDVPPSSDPHLYLFTVIGEVIDDGTVRIWITQATARELHTLLGGLEPQVVSSAILAAALEITALAPIEEAETQKAEPLQITLEAYEALRLALPGVSDEHSCQLLAQHLRSAKPLPTQE